jgi:hypothetical protein
VLGVWLFVIATVWSGRGFEAAFLVGLVTMLAFGIGLGIGRSERDHTGHSPPPSF